MMTPIRKAAYLSAVVLTATLAGAGPARSQSVSDAEIVAVVDAFHAALAAGDSLAAVGHLAEDVTILESGGVENKTQYRSGHLSGDMRYAQAVSRERGEVSVTVLGNVAWTHSTSVVRGRMGDRDVHSQSVELMVLAREGDAWRIRAIHWSSRQLR